MFLHEKPPIPPAPLSGLQNLPVLLRSVPEFVAGKNEKPAGRLAWVLTTQVPAAIARIGFPSLLPLSEPAVWPNGLMLCAKTW